MLGSYLEVKLNMLFARQSILIQITKQGLIKIPSINKENEF